MEESEENMSTEDVRKVDSPSAVKKPKKRSLVERELETNMTSRVTSPVVIPDGLSTSRYGRARRLKTGTEPIESVMSPGNENTPVKLTSPVYRMHASNSSQKAETPKMALETFLDNQIDNIYQENITLSRFSEESGSPSPAKKFPKIYTRKDLIQKKEEEEETIMLIKNLFSPNKSASKSSSRLLRNSVEHSSEKYISKQNGHVDNTSVVKTLDFDSKKKKENKSQKHVLSKNELFELEAKCPYQVGDIAWARMGTFPFWPCIITREPHSEMFAKKKLFGRVEHYIIHVLFFGDNGRRSWIVDNMLRTYLGQLEFERTKEKFTPEDKKKDPRLYAAFFVSEKKQLLWNTSVEEAETLLREPKRLRVDIFNDMLWKFRASKKTQKSGKITRTNSDVSLSESLYDSLFSEDDTKVEDSERSKNRSKNKSFDVSEVVTACLDNMAAKTGITKIQRQSHMDRWLQKAKSKTPEKSQTKSLDKTQAKQTDKTKTNQPEIVPPKQAVTTRSKQYEKIQTRQSEETQVKQTEKVEVKPAAISAEVENVKSQTMPNQVRIKLNRKISPKIKNKPSLSSCSSQKPYRFRKRHDSHSKLSLNSSNEERSIIDNSLSFITDGSKSVLDVIVKVESLAEKDNDQDTSSVVIDDDSSDTVIQPHQSKLESKLDKNTSLGQTNHILSKNAETIKYNIGTVLEENSDKEPRKELPMEVSNNLPQTDDKTSSFSETSKDIREIDEDRVNPDIMIHPSRDKPKPNVTSNVLLMEVDEDFVNSHSTYEINASNRESQAISQKSFTKANEHVQITNDLVDSNKEILEPCETQHSHNENNDNSKNLFKSGEPDQGNFEPSEYKKDYVTPADEDSKKHPKIDCDILGLHENSPDCIKKNRDKSKLNVKNNVLLMEVDKDFENSHSAHEINASNRESLAISQNFFTKADEHVQIANDLVDPNKEKLEPRETQYSNNKNNDDSKNLIKSGEPYQENVKPREDYLTPVDEDSKKHPKNNCDKLGLHDHSPDYIMKTKEVSKKVIVSIDANDEHINGRDMIKNLLIEVDGNSGSLVEATTKICDSHELSNEPDVEVDNINLDVQINEERSSLKSETVSNKSVEDNEFKLTANNCNINSDSVLKEAHNVVTIEESVTETKSDDTINNQAEGGRQENNGISKPLENTETNVKNMDFLKINSQSNIMKTSQVTSRPKTTSTLEKSKPHDQIMSNVATNCISSFSPDLEIEDVILDATNNFQKALIHNSCEKKENFCIEKNVFIDISTDNETLTSNDDKNVSNESGTSETILHVNEANFLNTDDLEKNTSLNESFQSESILEDSQLNNSTDIHYDEIKLTNEKIDDGTNLISTLEENPDSSTRQYVESPTFTQLLESEEFFRDVKESCNDLITTEDKNIAKVTKNFAVSNKVDNESEGTGDIMKNVVQNAVKNFSENYIDEDTSEDEPSPEYESLDEDIAEDFRKHMASIENNITDKKDEEQIVKICNEIAEKAKLSPTKYTTCVEVPKIKVKPDISIESLREPIVKEASSLEKQSNTIYNMISYDVIPQLIPDETNKEQDKTSESNYVFIKDDKKITIDIKKNIKSLILPKKVDMNVVDSEPSVFKINSDVTAKETSGSSKKKYKTRWSINSATKNKLASPAIRNGLSDIEQLRNSCEFEPKVMLVPLELENDKINILQGKCNKNKDIDEDTFEIKRKLRLSLRRESPTYEGTINKAFGNTEDEVKVQKYKNYKRETVVEREKMATYNIQAKIESSDSTVNTIKVHECKNEKPQNIVENEKVITPNNIETKTNTTEITEAEVTDRKYNNENTQNIAEKEIIVTRNKKRIKNKTTEITEVDVKVQECNIEMPQSVVEKEKIVTPYNKHIKNKTTKLTEAEVKVLKRKNEKPQTVVEEEKRTTVDNNQTKSKTPETTEAQVKYKKCNSEKSHTVAEKDEIVIRNKNYKKINIQNGTVETKKIAEVVKVNGYYNHVDRKYTNTPDSIDDTDFDIDSISINSEDSNISSARSLESTHKRNLRSRPERTLESALKNVEFLKYLELRQDYLMDEQPDLNEEEVVSYVYQTWQYEEDLKSNYKKSDDTNHSNIVKNTKQETPPRKKSKKSQPKNNIENYFREKYEKCRNTIVIDSEDGSCSFNSNKGIGKQDTLSKSPGDSGIENSKHHTEDVSVERQTRSKSLDSLDLTSEGSNDVVLVKDKYKDMDTVSVKSEESTPKRTLRSNAGTPKSLEKQNSDLKVQPNQQVKKERELDMESIDSEESAVPLRQLRSKALKEELIGEREKEHTPATKNAMITEITTQEQTLPSEIKDEFDEKASCVPDNEPLLKQKKKKNDKQPLDDPDFKKYFELRRDALMDENPHLSRSEIVSYLYKTWLYEENSKSDLKKNDEIEQASLVKGLNNNDAAPPKKVRRKAKTEKPTENVNMSREKPKRRIIQPYYNENYSDVEEDIEVFEIFKTKKVPLIVAPKLEMEKGTSNSPKESDKSETEVVSPKVAPKTEEVIEIQYDEPVQAKEEIDDDITCVDAIEYYFKALTNPKPNVFKGLIREKVCEICELAGDIVKCKGCHRTFHTDCVQREAERIYKESSSPSRGRKKKKGRKPKSLEGSESQSDEKSQNVSIDMTGEEILPPEICTFDAEAFESQLSAKMKELLDATEANYDSYSSDEGIDWKDTVAGKCEIVEVVLKRRRPPIDYSNFKCNDCLIHDTPVCFVCKSAVSKTNVKMRQKCHMAHCHKYYHLQCLDHWPQTQFNSGEPSRSNKKINEFFEALTCPRHVCHTCVSDDPRGCKTRFSADKLAKCVRCPATYHSFNKCLPAGTQILTASHIICPRHLDQIPGKVPCHVNTGWCFICAQGGSLICCEYCPTSFHAECLNIKPPEGNYMCEDCETGRLPLYGEMVWVKLGYYRWWPAMILHPSEIPENIMQVPHSLGEFVVRFFGQYDHFWVNRGRVFPYQEGDSGRVSTKTKIDAAFMLAIEHAQRAYEILKNAEPNDEESVDIASSLLPPHYVKLKCNKPCGSLCGRKVEDPSLSLTQCECDPDEPEPCGPYSQCLNRVLLTECGPTCLAGERCNNRAFEKRLYPKLVPYRTPQRGWGLKTLQDIKGGQFVIEYVGELIDEEEFRRRMQRKHEIRDENYYFLTLDKDRMIDAGPKGNLARFMNHCCEPNCETQKWTVLGDIRVGLFAINDIPANSEVTFNYNLQCAGIEKKRCMCGAKRCSGYIGAKPKQDESHAKKGRACKVPVTRTYKKKKPERSPSTSKIKPKRPLGRPRKPKELTEIEKDLLIIKTAVSVTSSEESSRTQSIEDKQSRRQSFDDKKFSETRNVEDKKCRLSQSIEDEKSSGSLSIDDKKSSRSKSIDGKSTKTLKRKRVSISTDEVSICNGCEPSVKKQKCEEKSSVVGD